MSTQRYFPFKEAPSVLRRSILRKCSYKSSLSLLKTTKSLRNYVRQNGPFPRKIERIVIDFLEAEVKDGRIWVKNLFISVIEERNSSNNFSSVYFGQPEFVSMFFGPFFEFSTRITPKHYPFFQKLNNCRMLVVQTGHHDVEESDHFDLLSFLPKLKVLDEMQFLFPGISEDQQRVFFDHFTCPFNEACIYNPGKSAYLTELLENRYNKCQILTIQGLPIEEIWQELSKSECKFLEQHLFEWKQVRDLVKMTESIGLPLKDSGELVIFTELHANTFYLGGAPETTHFEEMKQLFSSYNGISFVDSIEVEKRNFETWKKNPREFDEEKTHFFKKKINETTERIWKITQDRRFFYVFVKNFLSLD